MKKYFLNPAPLLSIILLVGSADISTNSAITYEAWIINNGVSISVSDEDIFDARTILID